jgi:hypothetical protein
MWVNARTLNPGVRRFRSLSDVRHDSRMDPLVREGLRPHRLIRGGVAGVLIAVLVIVLAGADGAVLVVWVGAALVVVFLAAWVGSVLYLRTERGRAARDEYLAKRQRTRRGRADGTG